MDSWVVGQIAFWYTVYEVGRQADYDGAVEVIMDSHCSSSGCR